MSEYGREAQSYQYLTDKFEVIHHTSVPVTDAEALEYFKIVEVWFGDESITYITKRAFGPSEQYQMMPYKYDPVRKEVTPYV